MRATNRQLWQAGLFGDEVSPGLPRRFYRHEEQGVLNAVLKVLRLDKRVAWVARMNSGKLQAKDGRWVRFGFPGCPDIIGQMRESGKFLAIEVKAAGGRLTAEQAAVLERVRADGGVAGVARSVDDAVAIIAGTG